MKKCSRCKLKKEDIGKSGLCRQCNTEYMREFRAKNKDKTKKYQKDYDVKYYQDNRKQILESKKEYYEQNKEEILEDRKEHYQEHKEEKQEYNKEYYQNNREELIRESKNYYEQNKDKVREYHNEYCKERRDTDPNFRIRASVSANINFYLKSNNSSKNGDSCLDYLPYNIEELKIHLENQFESWMT